MPRYEVGLRTQVAFRRFRVGDLFGAPETVGIAFEGRQFVWHANDRGPDGEEHGPTLTVVGATEQEYQEELPEAAERFLSALAYHVERPIESEGFGGSGTSDAFARAIVRVPRAGFGWALVDPPEAIEVGVDAPLRLALAVYREGLNATSSFYGFLSFWNTLDAVFEGDEDKRDAFIRDTAESQRWRWLSDVPWPADPALELRESSRHAIAHIVRAEGRAVIDPDLPADRRRLHVESRFLDGLAREAIESRWPRAVRVRRSDPGTE